MSQERGPRTDSGQPTIYQIRISGQLDARWADWFGGLSITLDGGDTLITGPVVDQAALHGLLRRVRDLGMPLVSVSAAGLGGSPTSTSTTTGRWAKERPSRGSAARSGDKR